MAERSFRNPKDGLAFAKETAISTKTTNNAYYRDGLFVVEWNAVLASQLVIPPSDATLRENDFSYAISNIHENLKMTENVDDLLNSLKFNREILLKASTEFVSSLSYPDLDLYKNIPNLLTHLEKASDAINDIFYVKSKEHATEIAYELHELAAILSEFGVAKCLRRHKQAMLEASESLKSENVAKDDAALSKKISILESSADCCNCGNGRFVIRQSNYGYFWGCSNFPTCFCKRALLISEKEFLGV